MLVIGARGFVGSAISAYLSELGVEPHGVGRDSYATERGNHFDVVINAAGDSSRRLADANPAESFAKNVSDTMATLVDFSASTYIHISSTSVYESAVNPESTREDSAIEPLRLSNYGRFKYLAEVLVRAHAANWLVIRLGALVGPGLKKNALYDLLERRTLFVSPESSMPYVDTRFVAQAVWALRESHGNIFNVSGDGVIKLRDVANELRVDIGPELDALPQDNSNINIDKLRRQMSVPGSKETVAAFVREWVRSRGVERFPVRGCP